jgi:two-component system nitrate/nitrite response regulator NarL
MRRQRFLPVILIGRSILLREGLARILRAGKFQIIASESNADDFRPGKSARRPLFLIVHAGDEFDSAVEQIKLCRSRYPDGRIAIVADRYRLKNLTSAFRAGANGFFVNVIACDRFVKSVELVMLGETIFPPAFLSFILDASTCLVDGVTNDAANGPVNGARNDSSKVQSGEPILVPTEEMAAPLLSRQEKLILHCLTEGDSNKCIARKMDIAEATVKVHVKAILRKIRVQNRTQAAIWGINNLSPARPVNSRLPQLNSEARDRHAPAMPEIQKIALGAISYQPDLVPGTNRFMRNSDRERRRAASQVTQLKP